MAYSQPTMVAMPWEMGYNLNECEFTMDLSQTTNKSKQKNDKKHPFLDIILDKERMKKEIKRMFGHLKPRDPTRINHMLDLLKEIWERYPDQRFFQLLENMFGCPKRRNQCFFYQEDDITEKRFYYILEHGFKGEHG